MAANAFGRYSPRLTPAAGTARPANVLILGIGVAGLQAIGTARRLGAVVSAYDVRPETGEQALSLGAKFIKLKPAIDAAGKMKPGSVIVDMAAGPLGGNCELSKAGESVVSDNAVTIIAPENLPAS